jgi:hypothetical protein
VENLLMELASRVELSEETTTVVRASIYWQYFDHVIRPNVKILEDDTSCGLCATLVGHHAGLETLEKKGSEMTRVASTVARLGAVASLFLSTYIRSISRCQIRDRDEMKMARGLPLVICAMVVLSGTVARAVIPAGPIPEVGWNGPGYLCEAAFTLEVRPDEFVREDIQLEPWYAPSNTIKSETGWFNVTVLADRPVKPGRRFELSADASGELYEEPPIDPNAFDKSFVFFPVRAGDHAVRISFFKVQAAPQSPDWRTVPQRSYPPSRYREVLKRFVFAKANPPDCLNRPRAQSLTPP